MKRTICMVALAAICFGTALASTSVKAVSDTTHKTKMKSKTTGKVHKTKMKKKTTKM